MIANLTYTNLIDNCFNNSSINEYNPNKECSKNSISFLNAYHNSITSTEEEIIKQRKIRRRIDEITKFQSFMQKAPSIFALSPENVVLSVLEKVSCELKKLSLDLFISDISEEDECVFMYGQKKNTKFLINIFFEEESD